MTKRNVIKLLSFSKFIDDLKKEIGGKSSQPSLVFPGKAGSLPIEGITCKKALQH
jgi:hypothetical protein